MPVGRRRPVSGTLPPVNRPTRPTRPRPVTSRPRPLVAVAVAALVALISAGSVAAPDPAPTAAPAPVEVARVAAAAAVRPPPRLPEARVRWRRSRAVGRPNRGRLVGGVRLPAEGTAFVTVDPVRRTSPSPAWRRHGTDRLVRVVLRVAREHHAAHPGAPRLVIGDLSRPRGGPFGPEFGGDGHRSHQNGLDVDVYYPRRDGRETVPTGVRQVDRRLAQELVDRFVRAGAEYVFVGPRTRLRGQARVVMVLHNHDDHLHVRIRPATGGRR
jgi:murein endopeptidase